MEYKRASFIDRQGVDELSIFVMLAPQKQSANERGALENTKLFYTKGYRNQVKFRFKLFTFPTRKKVVKKEFKSLNKLMVTVLLSKFHISLQIEVWLIN